MYGVADVGHRGRRRPAACQAKRNVGEVWARSGTKTLARWPSVAGRVSPNPRSTVSRQSLGCKVAPCQPPRRERALHLGHPRPSEELVPRSEWRLECVTKRIHETPVVAQHLPHQTCRGEGSRQDAPPELVDERKEETMSVMLEREDLKEASTLSLVARGGDHDRERDRLHPGDGALRQAAG